MNDLFVLAEDGKTPVAASLIEWARWRALKPNVRRVAKDHIGDAEVSTVFLGLDHRFFGAGPPLLFETMVFGGEHDGHQERCSTWAEAEEMHQRTCDLVRTERLS